MKRVEGYVDILNLLGITLETVLDGTDEQNYRASVELDEKLQSLPNVHILKNNLGIKVVFSVTCKDETYYFKYDSLAQPEHELFAAEVAARLGIPHVEYDLASFGPYKGVISKNFKDPRAKYITGLELIASAHPEEVPTFDNEEDEVYRNKLIARHLQKVHSFEGIWDALEIAYKDRPNCADIVSDLMNKLARVFAMDVILGNTDRHSENWELVEYPDGRVDLAPIFDNAWIFHREPEISAIGMTVLNQERDNFFASDLEENIENLIKTSSVEFTNMLVDSLWVLKGEVVDEILKNIRRKTYKEVLPNMAIDYRLVCAHQLNFLLDTLGLASIPISRSVDLDEILNLHNPMKRSNAELAVSIITPSQMVHATQVDGSYDDHPTLLNDVFAHMYTEVPKNMRDYCIEIRYVVFDKNRRYAYVKTPYYITPSELENLTILNIELKRHGFTVYSLIGEFDPLTGLEPKTDDSLDIPLDKDDIIEYIALHPEHVREYDLPFGDETIIAKDKHATNTL